MNIEISNNNILEYFFFCKKPSEIRKTKAKKILLGSSYHSFYLFLANIGKINTKILKYG